MPASTNQELCDNLIHNIITLRQQHGLSLRKMAAILHISPYLLRMLEKGQLSDRLYIDFIFCLHDYFKISFRDLFHSRL